MFWTVVVIVFVVFAAIGWTVTRRSHRGLATSKVDRAHAVDVARAQQFRNQGGDHNGMRPY
jgi:uncharacterized membrane protein